MGNPNEEALPSPEKTNVMQRIVKLFKGWLRKKGRNQNDGVRGQAIPRIIIV